MIARCAALAVAIAACSGSVPPGPDATLFCTGAMYDPCETEHDCPTTQCEPTGSAFILVCTIPCGSDGSACPDQNGVAVVCGSDGFCDPPTANACTLPP